MLTTGVEIVQNMAFTFNFDIPLQTEEINYKENKDDNVKDVDLKCSVRECIQYSLLIPAMFANNASRLTLLFIFFNYAHAPNYTLSYQLCERINQVYVWVS